jgi:16S rRNA processing protein RimM
MKKAHPYGWAFCCKPVASLSFLHYNKKNDSGRNCKMRPEFIQVGQIVNTHGVRGELKVNPIGLTAEQLSSFSTIYLDQTAIQPLSRRVHKNTLLLTLPGVSDMDTALSYRGKMLSIRRTDAHLPQGEYFDEELLGLTVCDCATGKVVGKITDVLTYPAHKVYEVKGEREYLIPAVPDVFIASVDPDGGTMQVHMMKGLATDEN